MKKLLIGILLAATTAAIMPVRMNAQTTDEPPISPEIKRQVELLRDDKKWLGARDELVKLARGGELTAIHLCLGDLWRSTEDEVIHERFYDVSRAVIRPSYAENRWATITEGMDELETRIAAIEKSAAKIAGDGKNREALDRSVAELRSSMLRFQAELKAMKATDSDLHPPSNEPLELPIGGDEPNDDAEPDSRPSEKKDDKAASSSAKESANGTAAKPSFEPTIPWNAAGDTRRIKWTRPYAEAKKSAVARNRLILSKPIMGGSNTPDPGGVPCGGVNDCEGSW